VPFAPAPPEANISEIRVFPDLLIRLGEAA
jgi:hypothetical protein